MSATRLPDKLLYYYIDRDINDLNWISAKWPNTATFKYVHPIEGESETPKSYLDVLKLKPVDEYVNPTGKTQGSETLNIQEDLNQVGLGRSSSSCSAATVILDFDDDAPEDFVDANEEESDNIEETKIKEESKEVKKPKKDQTVTGKKRVKKEEQEQEEEEKPKKRRLSPKSYFPLLLI